MSGPFTNVACPDKPIRLTAKDLRRVERDDQGRKWTVVSRPQPNGSYLVALVLAPSGKAQSCLLARDKASVARTVIEVLRWRSKLSLQPWYMSDSSRHRWGRKFEPHP